MGLCMRIENATDVARWRLCVGCGACATVCERVTISPEDMLFPFTYPKMLGTTCDNCGKCIEICPGLGVSHKFLNGAKAEVAELMRGWGPIIEVWEGYAADHEIRFAGSSGGAASAIALYCLESGIAGGVLHIGEKKGEPWRNSAAISRTRVELLSRKGSRYCPASPCEGLRDVESASSPHIFIGKPCDVHALRKAAFLKPELREKICIALGIFCAGTPATQGVLDLLAKLELPKDEVESVDFRGHGWPGFFTARLKNGAGFSKRLSYSESWGFLQAYRPFRCYLCPDGTSEFADISCGDPWYHEPKMNDPGRSLILVRTERGREILNNATKSGYLHLKRVDSRVLELSQGGLLMKRKSIWGRLVTMKAFGLPAPCYEGFPLFENWSELPFIEKARTIFGTAKRILRRKYFKPISISPPFADINLVKPASSKISGQNL